VFVPRPEDGSPDVAWLLTGEIGDPHLYAPDGGLPAGVDAAFPGREPNDFVLWFASRRTVVAGDTLVDFGSGLEIHEPWLWTTTREQVVDQLRPLLDLPVEHVLPTHGGPHDRAALDRVLA
jgi:glyoxylase-like metal-dependent hydrolase (beta-lactamase superfamily II)